MLNRLNKIRIQNFIIFCHSSGMSFSRISSSFTSAVRQTRKRRSPQRTSMKMKRKRRRTRLRERCCHVVRCNFDARCSSPNQSCGNFSFGTMLILTQDEIKSSVKYVIISEVFFFYLFVLPTQMQWMLKQCQLKCSILVIFKRFCHVVTVACKYDVHFIINTQTNMMSS